MNINSHMDSIERTTLLLDKAPLAAIAALGVFGCIGLVVLLLREKDRHAAELLELTLDTRATLIRFIALAEEERRPRRRRKADTGGGEGSGLHPALPRTGTGGDDDGCP